MYGSTTTVIAILICLANTPTPDLIIYQYSRTSLPVAFFTGSLVLPKKTTHAMYYNCGGLHQSSTKTKSAYCCSYRWIIGAQ